MARQSRPPAFLLTRPAAQGDRFAQALRRRFGDDIRVIDSPMMAPRFLRPALPAVPIQALIFTSETGVEAFGRISAEGGLAGVRAAWCVGDRTAQAARAAGLVALSANGDAAALTQAIIAARPSGTLLHLHGQEVRGDLAGALNRAGIDTSSAIVYAQEPQPLTPGARALLAADGRVLVPLFSPRTARLLRAEIGLPPPVARLWVAALSPAVAAAIGDLAVAGLAVAPHPDADAMVETLAGLMAAASPA